MNVKLQAPANSGQSVSVAGNVIEVINGIVDVEAAHVATLLSHGFSYVMNEIVTAKTTLKAARRDG